MSKLFKITLISLIAVFSAGLLFIPSTQTQASSLEVEFQNGNDKPLFDEANFLPGDAVTRYVRVTNNTGEEKEIGMRVINSSNPDGLGDYLNIEIKEGSNTLYDKTLTQFLNETDAISLSILTNRQNTQYDFSVSFFSGTENNYQEKSLGFDLEIGYFEEENGEGEPILTTFGGGRIASFELNIFNERLGDVTQTGATIIWQTNLNADSQIIYSSEHESHVLNISNPPYYGYAYAYPEPADPTPKTVHSVTIPGLQPCTDYYYRIVARIFPGGKPTISREFSFMTACVKGEETEERGEEGPEGWTEPGEEDTPAGGAEPVVEEITTGGELVIMPAPEVISGFFPNLLANIGDIFGGLGSTCYSCFPWWIILILAVYPLIESALNQRRDKRRAKKWFNWSLGLIVLAIIFYLTNYYCVAVWIYLVLALSTLLFWRFINPQGTKYPFIAGLLIILILFVIWLILECLYIWIIAIAVLIYLFVVDFLKRREKRE